MSLILVAAPDGAVTYVDRGLWLTLPFGMSWLGDLRGFLALANAAVTSLVLSDAAVSGLAIADVGDPHG